MKKVEWIGCCLLALFVGCSTDKKNLPEVNDNKLQVLSVNVPEKEISRAETTGINKVKIYATNSSTKGAYVTNNTGDIYEYLDGQWQVGTALALTSTNASVYACWPETATITPSIDDDAGKISISLLAEDNLTAGAQIDYLYATPITGVSSSNKAVSLTMQHALSKVSFRVEKAQAAESDIITLKKIEIVSGTNRLQSGTGMMSLAGGVLIGLTDRGSIVLKGNMTLNFPQSTPNVTALVAPMSTSESVLSFRLTVEAAGKDRVFETQVLPTAQLWEPGKHYVYHILVNKIGATLDGIAIDKWGSDANQDTSIGI